MGTHPELQRPSAKTQFQCASPRVRTLTELGDAEPLSGPASRCGAAGFLHPSAMRCASKASRCRESLDFPRRAMSKAVPSDGLRRMYKSLTSCSSTGHARIPQTIGRQISPNDPFNRLVAASNVECGADNMGIAGTAASCLRKRTSPARRRAVQVAHESRFQRHHCSRSWRRAIGEGQGPSAVLSSEQARPERRGCTTTISAGGHQHQLPYEGNLRVRPALQQSSLYRRPSHR